MFTRSEKLVALSGGVNFRKPRENEFSNNTAIYRFKTVFADVSVRILRVDWSGEFHCGSQKFFEVVWRKLSWRRV
jgi:hypothetical protein